VDDDLPEESLRDSGMTNGNGSPVAREAELHGTFPSSSALDKGMRTRVAVVAATRHSAWHGACLSSGPGVHSSAGVEQVADAAAALVTPGQQDGQQQQARQRPRTWLSQLGAALRGSERQAHVVYALFFAVFVADYSLLALAYPLSLLAYALLSQRPRRQYWQVQHLSRETAAASPLLLRTSVL
jgi:hypothetical protein